MSDYVTKRNKAKRARRDRAHLRLRKRVRGSAERPRLSVYKSVHHFYAQVIDDLAGHTVAAAASTEKGLAAKPGNSAAAAAVGTKLAEKARAAGVKKVVFDRGGFKYHGRVKAFADAARKAGLEF